MVTNPVLVLHGGAWAIPDEMAQPHLSGLSRAMAAGWAVLQQGRPALDAVEEAVAVMEDDPTFDAGRGAFLNREGRVQLDALIMDGATLRAGGVGCVERIRNAVRAARKVLEESPHVYFVGEGAEHFAQEHGIELCENQDLVVPREVERWRMATDQQYLHMPGEFGGATQSHDTVGALALDVRGDLAAATSTGGTLNKAPGRIGDSSLIGCGCYADNETAAASATGWGEPIMKLVLAKWATDRVRAEHSPEQAAADAIGHLQKRLAGNGGIIMLDRLGRCGLAHNTPRMAWGIQTEQGARSGIVFPR